MKTGHAWTRSRLHLGNRWKNPRDRIYHASQRGIAHRSQEHQIDTIDQFVQQIAGDRESHARFADPSASGERQETRLQTSEQHANLCHFVLAPNQWCEGVGKWLVVVCS